MSLLRDKMESLYLLKEDNTLTEDQREIETQKQLFEIIDLVNKQILEIQEDEVQ